jgi:hypothetical protein
MSRRGGRFLTPHRTGPPAAAGEFEIVRWVGLRMCRLRTAHAGTRAGRHSSVFAACLALTLGTEAGAAPPTPEVASCVTGAVPLRPVRLDSALMVRKVGVRHFPPSPPGYPRSGCVVMDLQLNASGSVTAAVLVRSNLPVGATAAVAEMLRTSKFSTPRLSGKPTPVLVRYSVAFRQGP